MIHALRVVWLRGELFLGGGIPGLSVDVKLRPFVVARGKLRRQSWGRARPRAMSLLFVVPRCVIPLLVVPGGVIPQLAPAIDEGAVVLP